MIWTKEEIDGIFDVLKNRSDLSIFVEYMNWKNYPYHDSMEYLHDYLKHKYQNKPIDILITTDDIALEFALKNRSELLSNAPVVFCGINENGLAKITSEYSNFTGVIEEIDPTGTIKMALDINPSLRNVYVLFDNSESGLSTGEMVINKIR